MKKNKLLEIVFPCPKCEGEIKAPVKKWSTVMEKRNEFPTTYVNQREPGDLLECQNCKRKIIMRLSLLLTEQR